MLKVTIPKGEAWVEREQRFYSIDRDYTLILEHSLVSIFKWEAEYKKCFLSQDQKTEEETRFYIKCMTINQGIPDKVYKILSGDVINEVDAYIHDKKTASVIVEEPKQEGASGGLRNADIMSAEKIYCMMILYDIPMEFEKWHFSRLLVLIHLVRKEHEKQDPNAKKKPRMSTNDRWMRDAKINAERCKRLGTKG